MAGFPELVVILALLAFLSAVFTVAYIVASGTRTERKIHWIAFAILLPVVGPVWYSSKGRAPARPDPEQP